MLQFFEKIFNRINTNVISVNNTTQIIGNRSGEYVVNGKTFKGNNISVINGVVYIDGKVVDKSNVGTNNPIIINIKGNVNTITTTSGTVTVTEGCARNIKTTSGDINVWDGGVSEEVSSVSGNVTVYGHANNVSTISGNIKYMK